MAAESDKHEGEVVMSRSSTLLHEPESSISIRTRIWEFMERPPHASLCLRRASITYEIVSCILLFVAFSFEIQNRPAYTQGFLDNSVEGILCALFALEYGLRLFSCVEDPTVDTPYSGIKTKWHGVVRRARFRRHCSARLAYAFTPMMILDLLTVLVLLAQAMANEEYEDTQSFRTFVEYLQIVKLLKVYRALRKTYMVNKFTKLFADKSEELIEALFVAVGLLTISAVSMYYIESPTNDQFDGVISSLWWATATLTTVGYGDIAPITPAGKCVAMLVSVMGIALFAIPAGIVASGLQDQIDQNKAAREEEEAKQVQDVLDNQDAPKVLKAGADPAVVDLKRCMYKLQADVSAIRAQQQEILGLLKQTS